jgi:hypothetical protein
VIKRRFYELHVVHAQMLQIIRVGALTPCGQSVGRNINNGERACSVALMRDDNGPDEREREDGAGFCCCCRSEEDMCLPAANFILSESVHCVHVNC